MERKNPYRRVAHLLWGGWELYGFLVWLGGGTVINIYSFIAYPFAQELPFLFKVLYGIGLFVAFLIISVIIIRVLRTLFISEAKSDSSQSISQSKTGRDIFQAGRDINLTQTELDNSTLEFSVKIETIQSKGRIIYLDSDPTQQSPPWLSIDISFRTNQIIQIASLYIQIDADDPRETIEPDEYLAQGFSLPHTLQRSETHQFQFRISPNQEECGHNLLLRVLAGGK